MDYFGAFRIFLRVSQMGSLSGVATERGMKVSTVSRQISRLEDTLGVALFNRTTRGLHLTEAGHELQARASRILSDVEDACVMVTSYSSAPRGILHLNVPCTFGRRHVMPHLAEFVASYPEIQVDVCLNDATVDLIESGTDIAIRIGALVDSTLIAKRLAGHFRMLVASPDYLSKNGVPTSPEDLVQHSCLLFTLQPSNTWYFKRKEEREAELQKLLVDGTIRANDSEALLEATLMGMGIALLPNWLIGGDLEAGRLVRVLGDFEWFLAPGPERAIWAVYPPTKAMAPKIRSFLEFISHRFRNPFYWE